MVDRVPIWKHPELNLAYFMCMLYSRQLKFTHFRPLCSSLVNCDEIFKPFSFVFDLFWANDLFVQILWVVVKAILLFIKCIILEHSQEKILHAKLSYTPFSLKFVFSCVIKYVKGCFSKRLGETRNKGVYKVKRKPDFFAKRQKCRNKCVSPNFSFSRIAWPVMIIF